MLYDRWCRIAKAHANELAILEVPAGRSWTFGELLEAAERGAKKNTPVVFPQGNSAEFVLGVLRGWHNRQVVCPLESGQEPPLLSGPLPAHFVHLKMTSATTGKQRLVAFSEAQLASD